MSNGIEPAERRGRAGRRGVLLAAALVAYPLLVHLAVSARPDSRLGEWLMAAALVAVARRRCQPGHLLPPYACLGLPVPAVVFRSYAAARKRGADHAARNLC